MPVSFDDFDPEREYTPEEFEELLAQAQERCKCFEHKLGRFRRDDEWPDHIPPVSFEVAERVLRDAGILDEQGNLAEFYR